MLTEIIILATQQQSSKFDESVIVAGGTPQLTLETGTSDAVVGYVSGSPGTTLLFNYTVAENHVSSDLDYASTSALALNGATIKDAAGNDATLTLATPGDTNSLAANKAIVIDGVKPTAAISFEIGGTSSTPPFSQTMVSGNGGKVRILATFSEAVKTSPVPVINVAYSGPGGAASTGMTKISSTQYRYDYTMPSGDGTATITMSVAQDLVGNVVVATPTSNSSFLVDNTAPTYSAGEVAIVDPSNISLTFTDAHALTATDLSAADFDIEKEVGGVYSYLHQGSAYPDASINFVGGNVIDISLNTAVQYGDTLYATYTKSATYTNQNIKDVAGNELASFTRSGNITNNVEGGEGQ